MNMEMGLSSWSVSRGCHLGQLERNLRLNPPFTAPRWKYCFYLNLPYRLLRKYQFLLFFSTMLYPVFLAKICYAGARSANEHMWNLPTEHDLKWSISFRFRPSKVGITRHSEGFSVVLSFHGCLPTTNRDSYSEEARLAPNARRQVLSQCL